jgi:hypothetical protein
MASIATSPTKESKLTAMVPVACLAIGLYAPSSISGSYSVFMWIAESAFLALLLSFLVFRRGRVGPGAVVNSIGIVTAVLAGTILSPYFDYRWGGLVGYLLLSMIYILDLRDIRAHRHLRSLFVAANIVNLVASVAMIWGIATVQDFVIAHYSAFYPELVETMTTLRKPVLTFATHSVAALFFYIFFWLNFVSFKKLRRPIDLFFAIAYVIVGFSLLSVSGIILMSWATLQLLILSFQRRPILALAICVTLSLSGWMTYRHFSQQIEDVEQVGMLASDILISPTNGFSGRFSELGTLYSTMNYFRANPFRPVGVGYRSDLFFGDCGPVEHYLRGSVILVATVYGGLYFFLRRNLLCTRTSLHLFIAIVLFEIGYSTLTYIRLLYLLPFVVVYLNGLEGTTNLSESTEPEWRMLRPV